MHLDAHGYKRNTGRGESNSGSLIPWWSRITHLSVKSHPGIAPGPSLTNIYHGACADVCVCVCVWVCVCVCACARSLLFGWWGFPCLGVIVRGVLQTPKEVGVVQLGPDLVGLGLLELDLLGSLAGSLACSLTCSLCPLGSTSAWGREGHNHATREPRPSRVGGGSESARSATPRRETGLCALPVRHGIRVLRGGGRADFDRVLASVR